MRQETSKLLVDYDNQNSSHSYLSLKFAVLCMVDMVGLFPVIALPRAIIDCGWLGLPLSLFVITTEIYTAILLGRCWIICEKLQVEIASKRRSPYGAIVELAFGKNISKYVKFIFDFSIFGAFIPDLLIASQNLQIIGLRLSRNDFDFSYCYWLIIIGILIAPLMWCGSPKDLKAIGFISVSTILFTSILTWTCIYSVQVPRVHIPKPTWESIGVAYGILAFQFDVHPMILSVQMDMKKKSDISKAVIIAVLINGILFLITYLLCYVHLGDKVGYNTLQSLPQSFELDVVLCLSTLQVCLSMGIGSISFFQDVENSLGIEEDFTWKRAVLRTCVVLSAVALGEAVPRAELLMGLVGGALTGQLMFLFPPLLYWRLQRMSSPALDSLGYGSVIPLTPKGASHIQSVILFTVAFVGCAATACSTFFSFRGLMEYADFVPPCLVDINAASHFISKII